VISNDLLTALVVLAVSITAFLICRAISGFFSGPRFSGITYVLCFILSAIWVASQIQIVDSGTPFFFNAPIEALAHNDFAKWIALLSIPFQGYCLPKPEKLKWWFLS